MSATARQSELFAGESWTVLYNSFVSINFNATDPVSINQALQNYIQVNYPEQFNDWIVRSEFVAIIDLLSWLAGTLAFKTDIAARENFIDTAEARSSILRLARFLSYNPSRCQPATGVLKITQISTDDDVYDDFGIDLINTPIIWNDPNNSNWFEQFTAILNAAFVNTNPFGVPISEGTVSNVSTQLYRLNGLASNTSLGFTSTVSGTEMDFEVCNGDFTNGGSLFERAPNPANAFQFYYLNDGKGNSSTRTGFFLLFKQGTTQSQTFNITIPVVNQLIDISSINVNQNDVWVDTVDDQGNVLISWTNVPAIFNSNITYNDLPVSQRNIFSVITRDNDQITIRFADGQFGNAPVGNISVTYRVSNGLTYQINPLEIDNIQIPFSYLNSSGVTKTLYVNFSLAETVSNATAAETIEQIRQRAPQVYGTQNRMVSGEDYNTFPLATNLAVKIQAVNRVYSGQSRYIDLNDPTGTYKDLSIFSEDGIFFRETSGNYFEVPLTLNLTTSQIVSNYIQPTLSQYTISNLISDVLLQNIMNGNIYTTGLTWTTSSANLFFTTGWFSALSNLIQPGAIIQFNIAGTLTWVAVIDIAGPINVVPPANTAGPVTLAQEVPTGSQVVAILPSATVAPSSSVITAINNNLSLRLSFSLWYDYNPSSSNGPTWVVNASANDFGEPEPELVGTQLQIMNVNYISGLWQITARGLNYVFESISNVQWYDNGQRSLAQYTAEAQPDLIRILKINQDLNNIAGFALTQDYNLIIDRMWSYSDGATEPRRSTVLFNDSNQDGYPDDPSTYYKIVENGYQINIAGSVSSGVTILPVSNTFGISVGDQIIGYGIAAGTSISSISSNTITISSATLESLTTSNFIYVKNSLSRGALLGDPNTYLFWSNAANPPYDAPLYSVIVYDTDTLLQAATPPAGTVGFQVESTVTYLDDETFWVYNGTSWQQDLISTYRMEKGRGPNVAASWVSSSGSFVTSGDEINFHWKHYAPSDHRIDPACTNIHDIFVLTFAYDTAVRNWIANGAIGSPPTPPTELDLSIIFSALETYKMFSDTMVWRPVTYKFLFGPSADPELQAQFKVVRLVNPAVSDGQIQSQIITAINTFFDISNWNFGETFYFTELAAYIHQQLVGLISSVVIVPLAADASFGDGFETSCNPNEIFISTAQVSSIVIIQSNTNVNLRIAR